MGARSPDVPYPSFTLAMVQSGYSPHPSRKNKKKAGRRSRPRSFSRPNRARAGEFMVRASSTASVGYPDHRVFSDHD